MSVLHEFDSRLAGFALNRLNLPRAIDFLQDKVADILSAPEFLRTATFALRNVKPTLLVGELAVVTRFADVLEVLDNDASFRVVPIYAREMEQTTGSFILGMDDHELYEREAKFLRAAVLPGDLERVRTIVEARARELLDAASLKGVLDVATGYAHKIALAVVAEHFGVSGPNEATMSRWMRTIFWDLFLNQTKRTSLTEAARRSAAELHSHLEEQASGIRTRLRRGESTGDDFFSRLVRTQREFGIDDSGVRRNIGGIIVGAVDTVSKAIVHAFDQLLRRPDILAKARAAAQALEKAEVAAFAFEALRFNPHNSFIIRHCAADFRLARGTDRETLIVAGTTTYASTLSAMFDSSVLLSPHEFRTDRPWEHYVHFGHGMHRCFGERFNRVIVPEAIRALLLRPNVQRTGGHAGQIQYEGPFPTRLLVKM
jgi:cytochrome P450